MKPNTVDAMHHLIKQIKDTLPFSGVDASFCSDTCRGCSVKLIDFIAIEVEDWEHRLDQGDTPSFKDIDKLAKMTKKIHAVLLKNNLI